MWITKAKTRTARTTTPSENVGKAETSQTRKFNWAEMSTNVK